MVKESEKQRKGEFWKYQVYRKRFIETAAVVVILCIGLLLGILFFLVRAWSSELEIQTRNLFSLKEQRLSDLENWALNYTSSFYEDKALMDDMEALFASSNQAQYLEQRKQNSLSTRTQIKYFPAYIQKLFFDERSKINGVTMRSSAGIKAIWMENWSLCLNYDFKELDRISDISQFGDILVASCTVRNPQHMGSKLGILDYWMSAERVFGAEDGISAAWGVLNDSGTILTSGELTREQMEWVKRAYEMQREEGWLFQNGKLVFFTCYLSGAPGDFCYVTGKDVLWMLSDHRNIVWILSAAFILIIAGVLFRSYCNFCSEARFLNGIMKMLSLMEHGNFDQVKESVLPDIPSDHEYGMIAQGLKDVGLKLQGYIETEYVWKLKEQESQMRALQQQINPHFLYNTLEILRSKALIHEDRETADAIALLGTLYRARTYGKDVITLKEEFALLEMYLKIMELRFEGRFVYQMELDRENEDIPTINFWMQPLAENFFKHGFDKNSEYNLLLIRSSSEGDGVRISVADNGTGTEPKLLERIQQNMYGGTDDPQAEIGLRNVYMRLRYFYGESFSMEILNEKEGGFGISIWIPKKRAGERKDGEHVYTDDRR